MIDSIGYTGNYVKHILITTLFESQMKHIRRFLLQI